MDGFVRRIRGGAIPATSRSYEPPILTRESQNHDAKIRIGRAAAELLRDGETVILGCWNNCASDGKGYQL
jgi:DeoR/GlpR family transcriptional regulator of sugar metabolism